MQYGRTPSIRELTRGTYSVSGSSAMQLYTDVVLNPPPLFDPNTPSWESLDGRFRLEESLTPPHFSQGHGYHLDYRADLIQRLGEHERKTLLTKGHIEDIK